MTPLIEEIVPPPDPIRSCERFADVPYRVLLDSANPTTRFGQYSFLAADPVTVVQSRGSETEVLDLLEGRHRPANSDPLTLCRDLASAHRIDVVSGVPPFQGGFAGYVGYEWGLTLERLPAPRYDDLRLPDVVLALYDWVLAWDHLTSRAWLISTGIPERSAEGRTRRAADRVMWVRARLSGSSRHVASRAPVAPQAPDAARAPHFPVSPRWSPSHLSLESSFTHAGYLDAVARVREYIFAGDIFQANLSQRFEAPFTGSPWAFYTRLRAGNAAPFAAFLDLPDFTVVSASPERFLRVDHRGAVETRPIKGTRPRGVGPEHDAALGQALAESAKDRAENLMIVDLMRNDLSRVCVPHSVRVSELFSLERFATVHHLVSTVVGQLGDGFDAIDLLRAAFPGGSITGAPKLRAMEIIAELEPSRRGVYCGSIGYWSLTGELDTSIAIRTAVIRDGRVYFSAGGGVVADSVPEQEYLETLDKARAMIDALADLR